MAYRNALPTCARRLWFGATRWASRCPARSYATTHATHEFVAQHAHMVKIHGIEVDGQMSKGTDGAQALKGL
jgi:hypothetical protein